MNSQKNAAYRIAGQHLSKYRPNLKNMSRNLKASLVMPKFSNRGKNIVSNYIKGDYGINLLNMIMNDKKISHNARYYFTKLCLTHLVTNHISTDKQALEELKTPNKRLKNHEYIHYVCMLLIHSDIPEDEILNELGRHLVGTTIHQRINTKENTIRTSNQKMITSQITNQREINAFPLVYTYHYLQSLNKNKLTNSDYEKAWENSLRILLKLQNLYETQHVKQRLVAGLPLAKQNVTRTYI